MLAALDGFVVIAIVIAVGMLLAHTEVIDQAGQQTLSNIAFLVASPALLLSVLQHSRIGAVFSGELVASAVGVVLVIVAAGAVSVLRHDGPQEAVIAVMASVYCNAANLGLPVATYVLGGVGLVAPVMLLQLIAIQPLALTILDSTTHGGRLTPVRVLRRAVQNPITIGSLIGVLLAITHVSIPSGIGGAIDLLGDMSVPSMLLAYGASLRLGPLPGRGVAPALLGWHVGLKMVAQPLVTYLFGRLVIDLTPHQLFSVTVIAALPTAQNVFVIASRYGRGTVLARDVIFVSTVAAPPVMMLIVALLS